MLFLAAASAAEQRMARVLKEFDRICRGPLWPGYEPCRTPLAIFDGQRTWLVRHPNPPPEFVASRLRGDSFVFSGHHAALRANTGIELAGTPTASAMLDDPSQEPRLSAALLIHEAFHVFQAKRHPGWGANEADLFVYPVEIPPALALRRLESESLRRALAAGSRSSAGTWAARALEVRRERFALLPTSAASYERGTETKEGLARYVEARAGGPAVSIFPEAEFSAGAVRDRAYASGAAMALLLDRLDPDWKRRFEKNDTLTLDELLGRAAHGARAEVFSAAETQEAGRRAEADVAAWVSQRSALRREILEAAVWKVVLEAEDPVFPQGFDPLNVERLSASEVLHKRWIKLGNASGSLETLGRRCLTVSAGKHPLFEGVSRATVALAAEPRVEERPGILKISAEGLTLEFRGARLIRSDHTLRVEIPKPPAQ